MALPHGILPALPPDALQHIAQYLGTSNEMRAFLTALPIEWLTPPMVALLELYDCVLDGRLVDTSAEQPEMVQLWPKSLLPRFLFDGGRRRSEAETHLAALLYAYMPLLPYVELRLGRTVADIIPPETKLHVMTICSPNELARARTLGRLETLDVFVYDDTDSDDANWAPQDLHLVPTLRNLKLYWCCAATAALHTGFIESLVSSNVTRLSLHYDVDDDASWTDETVNTFARWMHLAPITALKLVKLSLRTHLRVQFATAILTSQTLASLKVEGGNLPRVLFNLCSRSRDPARRFSLPVQLETLETNVRNSSDVVAFALALRGANNLRRVSLFCDVGLDNRAVLALRRALMSLARLRSLELGCCSMPLIPTEQMQRLVVLELRRNYAGDMGIIPLAQTLPQCQWLQQLSLINQECTHLTAQALAAAIPHCPSLKVLDLSFNEVGSEGLIALLPSIGSLDVLVLQANDVDADGAYVLADDIDATAHLTQLDLSGNPISEDGVLSLIDAIGSSLVLRHGVLNLCETVDDEDERENCAAFADERLPIRAWCKLQ
ncbi:hypothetical protein SDRG_00065 [Saprolegnia diclina VS20]|uniref:F-box domain-containing protein n=1 Tax=Saprolegnia diclina (strain VS20) TaxID=1156394 RepID=T0R5W1_SAPDV|nr:hypothetical protein SDRG_00065 [Saprolegnia diclina VS20]EQC42326.1 hypothetical protein SDRG_00065 [Saprolegnia diclina VS20]|eukprot:XP_008603749.1 hypothetical protein SDRG_00065 [Saprolegnia diclina VS20]